MGLRHRYSRRWWYIERPFPWQLVVVVVSVAALLLICLFAVIVGCHYLPWWH